MALPAINLAMKPHLEKAYTGGILSLSGAAGAKVIRDAWRHAAEEDRQKALSAVRENLDLLIVGTPGGGTAFVGRLLTACGRKCGHEAVFRPHGIIETQRLLSGDIRTEISGFAQQWLSLLPVSMDPVQLVRHPVDAINSQRKHFSWDMETAAAYWQGVHESALGDIREWVRLERCLPWVAEVTGQPLEHVEARAAQVDRNAHEPPAGFIPTVWEDLPLECRYVANQLGYHKTGLRDG